MPTLNFDWRKMAGITILISAFLYTGRLVGVDVGGDALKPYTETLGWVFSTPWTLAGTAAFVGVVIVGIIELTKGGGPWAKIFTGIVVGVLVSGISFFMVTEFLFGTSAEVVRVHIIGRLREVLNPLTLPTEQSVGDRNVIIAVLAAVFGLPVLAFILWKAGKAAISVLVALIILGALGFGVYVLSSNPQTREWFANLIPPTVAEREAACAQGARKVEPGSTIEHLPEEGELLCLLGPVTFFDPELPPTITWDGSEFEELDNPAAGVRIQPKKWRYPNAKFRFKRQ